MSTDRAPRTARAPTTGPDPRITVAVITRDRCASLLRTLDALAALPERPPVIVVDNSSSDTTRLAVQGHPAVTRLLRPGTNTGTLGRNLAVRHARTPTSPSATTTPGGPRALRAGPPTSSTATHGSACSPPAPSSARRPPTTR